eukprot:scpid25179/ scgid0707/ Retinoblastoma-like protein 1; 107 kDa retinoblastoma-associated protein; pRb1
MAELSLSDIRREFDGICSRLNMDQATLEVAWKSFHDLKEFYTLEGNQNHWLACALFVACRTAIIPTVAGGTSTTGNRVTLYNIIRETKISLLEFFEKMKRWVEMALKHGLAKEVPTLVDNLEHRFRVITLIYRKYEDLFDTVFATPSEESRRKTSRSKCSAAELHKFVWTLFVHARACLNGVQDNLVNSFHLLICVVETMYLSAQQANRTDLISASFTKAVDASIAEDPAKEKEVVDFLCQRYEAEVMEVKVIREHWWERHLDDIKEKNVLLDHLHEIVEGSCFLRNSKKLNREYEEYVLKRGDLDERVFLGEFAQAEVGTPIKVPAGSSVVNDGKPKNLERFFANANSGVVPHTPLTGDLQRKAHLRSPAHLSTPVTSALHNLSRIKSIISNQQTGTRLAKLCKEIDPNPYEAVSSRVEKIKQLFVKKYCAAGSDITSQEEGRTICALGSSLYLKVLEAVAIDEYEKRGTARLLNLLQADDMHWAMFGCCLQIVLATKNTSDKMFPWIIEAMDISAYSFARVIESVIHFEPNLSTSMVKSLKVAEEQLLESLVWRSGSPVFNHIHDIGKVYRFKEVALPESSTDASQLQQQQQPQQQHQSPLVGSQHRIPARKLTFEETPPTTSTSGSSSSSSCQTTSTAGTRTSSQVDTTNASSTGAGTRSTSFSLQSLSEAASMVSKESSSVTKMTNAIATVSANSVTGTGAVAATQTTGSSTAATCLTSTGDTPIRGGDQAMETATTSSETPPVRNSVSLFLRKVYHLASMRLNFLCQRLQMDAEQQQTCWTCFEECLVQHIDELKDRHIDQFIMCSIYAIGKVLKKDVEFGDIVKYYRYQPHMSSVTYRQVMISRSTESAVAVTANSKTVPDPKPREQAEALQASLTPKGSPVTRSSLRRQQQHQHQQLKQTSSVEKPSSPRRSPRKRPHENESAPLASGPVRGPLFASSPPRKRKDHGTAESAVPAVSSIRNSSPLAENPLASTCASSADVPMDTGEQPTSLLMTPKKTDPPVQGAPPGLLSPPVALPDGQCIGDIIAFYNKVYLKLMKNFLMQFVPERIEGGTSPCLSPMPKNKKATYSPRKQVSAHHKIFVSPRKKDLGSDRMRQQEGAFLYCHQRSSLSELTVINDRIRRGIGSPVKAVVSPRPANPQSPLTSVTNASPRAGGTTSKSLVPSGIMVESVSLPAGRSQSRPVSSPSTIDRHKSVTKALHQRAEERWINSKGLSEDMSE